MPCGSTLGPRPEPAEVPPGRSRPGIRSIAPDPAILLPNFRRRPGAGGGAAAFALRALLDTPGAVLMYPRAGCRPADRDHPGGPMKFRPLHDRILVRRIEEQQKSKGGIIIPDTAKEKPQEGRVIAVGNGRVLEDGSVRPLDVKKGDRILFGKYSGSEIKIDGEEHTILREDDVLAVVE
jgi:chaperonin GroES